MEIINFTQFFWIPNLIYLCLGFDFQNTARPRWQIYLLKMLLSVCIFSSLFVRYYSFKQLYELISVGDITNSISLWSYVAYGIDSNIKFLTFTINRRRLRFIYETLKREYPQRPDEYCDYGVERHCLSGRARLFIYIYFASSNLILLSLIFQSFGEYFLEIARVGWNNATFPYLHPIPIAYNFNYRAPFSYFLLYICEVLYGYFNTLSNMGTDLFMCLFASQISMHFEWMSRSLEAYEPSVTHEKEDHQFLIKIIRKHQLMFTLRDELNNIFGISLLFILLSCTGVFCILALQLIVDGLSFMSMKFLLFTLALIVQLFMVCFYCHRLINTSENVALSAYNNHWYNGSKSYKKLILLIMLRGQKCANLTAGGFHPISLETFQMVMNMTYRIFTVLRTRLG